MVGSIRATKLPKAFMAAMYQKRVEYPNEAMRKPTITGANPRKIALFPPQEPDQASLESSTLS
jgi:hypothetical protein